MADDNGKTDDNNTAIETQLGKITETLGTITETLGTITETLQRNTQRLDQFEGKIGTIEERLTAAKNADDEDDDADADDDKGGKAGGDGSLSKVLKLLEKQNERIEALAKAREQDQQAQTAAQLVEAHLEQYPGITGARREQMRTRLLAAKPASSEDVTRAFEAEKKYAETMGLDVKSFAAQPAKEGAKSGGDETDDAEEQDKKRIETIRARGRTGL